MDQAGFCTTTEDIWNANRRTPGVVSVASVSCILPPAQTPTLWPAGGARMGQLGQGCSQREHMRARARKRRSGSRHVQLSFPLVSLWGAGNSGQYTMLHVLVLAKKIWENANVLALGTALVSARVTGNVTGRLQ